MPSKPHVLKRISPLTAAYIGKCVYCGLEDIPQEQAVNPCPARKVDDLPSEPESLSEPKPAPESSPAPSQS